MFDEAFQISEINARFEQNRPDGIFAWVSLVINRRLFISNIALRKDENGEISITFPAKKRDDQSSLYFYHKPINAQCYTEIRDAIVSALNLN